MISACLAVGKGSARHVLVYRTVQMMGGTIDPKPDTGPTSSSSNPRAGSPAMSDVEYLLAAHAYSAANWLAMHCQRHMDLYGTTKEQLGWLAINARRNAALNPLAVYREPITMDQYLSAEPISTPFGLLDCDVPVDGSIAVVGLPCHYGPDAPHRAVSVEAIGGSAGTGGMDPAGRLPEDGLR